MNNTNKLYYFLDSSIPSDILNDKGKVTRYKEVYCISNSENNSRVKSKLDEKYVLIEVKELGKDWN